MTQPKWFVHISPSRLSAVAFKAYRVNCLDNQAVVFLRGQMNIRLRQGCADSQNLTCYEYSRALHQILLNARSPTMPMDQPSSQGSRSAGS
jgi:hypothetical protein